MRTTCLYGAGRVRRWRAASTCQRVSSSNQLRRARGTRRTTSIASGGRLGRARPAAPLLIKRGQDKDFDTARGARSRRPLKCLGKSVGALSSLHSRLQGLFIRFGGAASARAESCASPRAASGAGSSTTPAPARSRSSSSSSGAPPAPGAAVAVEFVVVVGVSEGFRGEVAVVGLTACPSSGNFAQTNNRETRDAGDDVLDDERPRLRRRPAPRHPHRSGCEPTWSSSSRARLSLVLEEPPGSVPRPVVGE